MAKDKERSVNPALAQRRQEKQKALKKGKSEIQARRNEKLARRNPQRLQKQIDDLKAVEESGQSLRTHQKQTLEGLERDLQAVKKAREALGDKAPSFSYRGDKEHGQHRDRDHNRQGVLGKRRREGGSRRWGQQESSGSETDESVRKIPMPRDTPPPIPRRQIQHRTGANAEPRRGGDERTSRDEGTSREPEPALDIPTRPPPPQAKAVYEAAPVVRNLRKEAVDKFVPAAVRMKQAAVKGQGSLVEPEEMDKLEEAGYVTNKPSQPQPATGDGSQTTAKPSSSMPAGTPNLDEEEERFNRELKSVQIEEVEDEDL